MMEWVQSEGKFKFLSAGNGVIRTLSETYKSSLLHSSMVASRYEYMVRI